MRSAFPFIRTIVFAVGTTMLLIGCSKLPPEVSVNDQVPADQRTEAAASDGATAAADAAAPTWVAVDIAFDSAPESLEAGNTAVTLINNGAAVHDVTFEQLDDETVVVAQGGGQEEATVELKPGTYTYYCSVPGHREAGMEGQVTVGDEGGPSSR